jgi:hypothetical protein
MLRLLFLAFDAFLNIVLPLPPAPKPTAQPAVREQPKPQPRPTPPRRDGMEPGSEVVVLADPVLWGKGTIASVGVDGRLRVEFDRGPKLTLVETFDALELELWDRFMAMERPVLTQRDLRHLRQRDTRKHGA